MCSGVEWLSVIHVHIFARKLWLVDARRKGGLAPSVILMAICVRAANEAGAELRELSFRSKSTNYNIDNTFIFSTEGGIDSLKVARLSQARHSTCAGAVYSHTTALLYEGQALPSDNITGYIWCIDISYC